MGDFHRPGDKQKRMQRKEADEREASETDERERDTLYFLASPEARKRFAVKRPEQPGYDVSHGLSQKLWRFAEVLMTIRDQRETGIKRDQKGFCDIFGRTFLQLAI